MKKSITGAVILVLALIRAGAATWEGSAIAGGAGDFPAEGYYAACNSFPRDSVVELSNLENGRAVTVTIVGNVDNPGVFIALSPKTAEALGMKPGAAIRVRAASLAASSAEATLPPARAGISADPDFNPRVFFEREKAAMAAAAGEAQAPAVAQAAPPASAPPAATSPAQQPAAPTVAAARPAAPEPAAPAPQAPAAPTVDALGAPASAIQTPPAAIVPEPPAPAIAASEAPVAEQGADVIALASGRPIEAPQAQPPLREPKEPAPAIAAAVAPPTQAVEKPPLPDTATVSALTRPTDKSGPMALTQLAEPAEPEARAGDGPEVLQSRVPAPAAEPNVPLLSDAEPLVRDPARDDGIEALALEKPAFAASGQDAEIGELAEAEMPGLPEAVYVAKPAAPGSASVAELAEAEAPSPADAIGTDRPLPPAAAPLGDVAMGEPIAPKEPAQTGVVAIGGSRPSSESRVEAALADPEIPSPSENLVAAKPSMASSSIAIADEPGVRSPLDTGAAPTALSAERPEPLPPSVAVASLAEPKAAEESATGAFVAARPAMPTAQETALADPDLPTLKESLTPGPKAPAPEAETVVALEPALPRPPEAAPAAATAPVMVPAAPSAPSAVATINGSGGIAEPSSAMPVIKGLDKGSFYIQIGVYGTNDALMAATIGLGRAYPVAVERISTKAGASAYRLYIGPIARDESGLALLKIRSMGYKDAFVRQGS